MMMRLQIHYISFQKDSQSCDHPATLVTTSWQGRVRVREGHECGSNPFDSMLAGQAVYDSSTIFDNSKRRENSTLVSAPPYMYWNFSSCFEKKWYIYKYGINIPDSILCCFCLYRWRPSVVTANQIWHKPWPIQEAARYTTWYSDFK